MSLERLLPASFRGVTFLCPNDRLTEGRKTVTHEYVNSDKRFVEDLGAMPPKFSMTIIIADDINFNADEKRDQLRNALKTPGPGLLIHPVYGRQEVTVEGEYEVSREDRELGSYSFNVTFAVSEAGIQPDVIQAQQATVFARDVALRSAVFQRMSDQWIAPRTSVSSQDAIAKVNIFTDIVRAGFSGVSGDKSGLLESLDDLSNGAALVVRSGPRLASSVSGIFDIFDDIGADALSIFKAIASLFDYGSDDIAIRNRAGLSLDQYERQINRNLLNSSINAAAVSRGYSFATQVDYLTDVDLVNARSDLDAQTRKVINDIRSVSVDFDAASNRGVNITPTSGADVIQALQTTRTGANAVFAEKELNAYRIGNLNRFLTSGRLLSYSLYENTDNAELVENLNKSFRPSGLTGDLTILVR